MSFFFHLKRLIIRYFWVTEIALEFDEQFDKEEFQTIVNVEEEDDGSMESKQDKMEALIICSHQI